MTRLTRLCRAVGVGLAVVTATLSMTQVADAAPAPPDVPANLVPTSGQIFLVGHAKGVQIYTCDGVKWGPSTQCQGDEWFRLCPGLLVGGHVE